MLRTTVREIHGGERGAARDYTIHGARAGACIRMRREAIYRSGDLEAPRAEHEAAPGSSPCTRRRDRGQQTSPDLNCERYKTYNQLIINLYITDDLLYDMYY